MKRSILFLILFTLSCAASTATAQSGGTYAITQSVIAGGGGQNSTGGTYAVDGTIGQSVAGQPTTGAPYAINAGFWTPQNFAPTAAQVTLGGRVTTANGAGIRNVLVTLIGADGASRTVLTGAGGAYTFNDVAAGATYIISVSAKRYRFAQPTRIQTATEDFLNINFVSDSNSNIWLTPILTVPSN